MAKKRTVEARSPEYERLGIKLAEARKALDLSQSEAAKRIGVTQSTYSGWETGTRRIRLSMLQKIASVYNVSVDSLIDTDAPEELILSDRERVMIIKFRELSEVEQLLILRSLGITEQFSNTRRIFT